MKYSLILIAAFFVLLSNTLFAQEEITDEEIRKYAVTMDSINNMKASLLDDISVMVKSNEDMTNERYNELSKIIDDNDKLAEAKATPEEIAFIKEVAAKKKQGTAKISKTFQTMAKEYVGAATYNKVKKALKTDADVKSRYQAVMDELEKDNNVDEEEATN
ncbi:MAG: hypothetical protein OEV74_07630 [Cyclobacteriaceae bacterium]|jgi:hypothetical protein|nr:hypothetical protein [Cyclobacteriaceae bacterium]MDH4296129.1 hypothetical protein [Cyclobacteriaceae bacterium]MDH5248989.1 hypothetical protein [Cyclobacteriaceae bacterium]